MWDEESGLSWTRFRCFDAETGRWLSADPLGLANSRDEFGFDGVPVQVADPLGLATDAKRGLAANIKDARSKNLRMVSRFVSEAEKDAIVKAGRPVCHPHEWQPTRLFDSEAVLRDKANYQLVKDNKDSYKYRVDFAVTDETMQWLERHSIKDQVVGHQGAFAISRKGPPGGGASIGSMIVEKMYDPVKIQG